MKSLRVHLACPSFGRKNPGSGGKPIEHEDRGFVVCGFGTRTSFLTNFRELLELPLQRDFFLGSGHALKGAEQQHVDVG